MSVIESEKSYVTLCILLPELPCPSIGPLVADFLTHLTQLLTPDPRPCHNIYPCNNSMQTLKKGKGAGLLMLNSQEMAPY